MIADDPSEGTQQGEDRWRASDGVLEGAVLFMIRTTIPIKSLWLLAVVIVLALGSCNKAAPLDSSIEPSQVPMTETEAQEQSRQGNLKLAMQPMVQVDPAFISSDTEVLVASHVYDYLVDVDPASNVVPRLATDWSISPDGLTYTFQIAAGASFQDGSLLTAEDVAWTFNRLRDAGLGVPTSDLYQNIVAVEVTGDLEVTFSLAQANPFFLYDLSDNHALVVKAGTADFNEFNGSGPFRVTAYSPEDRIVLAANPHYFMPDLPKLAGLEIIFFNDDHAMVDALRGGQIDLAMRMSTDLFTSLQGQPGIRTIAIPTNGFDLVRLRADRPPGNDPRVMQAIKLATDRGAIFQLVQQGYGALGKDSPVGPLYELYHAEDLTLPARDIQAARDLLVAAGYEEGISLDLHVPNTGNRPDLAVVLKSQWAEAGIDVNVVVEPESIYFGDDRWLEVDLGITNWGSRPYPQFYLDVMLKCGAIWNEAHYCDDEFDRLVTLAGTTLDEQARIDAYRQIQAILIERGPVLIPYYFAQLAAISEDFMGFDLKAFAGRSDLRFVETSEN
jgi:peptide/nickel transport system substrate-binding protein